MKAKEEELRNAMCKTQELISRVKELEEKMATLSQEKNDLTIQLQAVCGAPEGGRELGALATTRIPGATESQTQGGRWGVSLLRISIRERPP